MPDEEEAAGSARDHQQRLSRSDPVAQVLVEAIHAGEVGSLTVLLREHPGLASARLVDDKGGSGTPLHAVTDWPGYFPHGPEVAATLIDAGADPNASVEGSWHAETPLHWAANSDDVEVARALIDGGADIEATGASIAGGTPLDDAVGIRVLAGGGCGPGVRRSQPNPPPDSPSAGRRAVVVVCSVLPIGAGSLYVPMAIPARCRTG